MGAPPRWPGGRVRHISVLGGTVAVETLGAGPPLVMLHGWTLDRRMWLPQLPLARCLTLVGIDRRGFGQATAPPDLAAEPDDILRVVDALGLARFHLLGMSQGGRVAIAFAARAADRLLSLTLLGTALDDRTQFAEDVPVGAMSIAARSGDLAPLRSLWRCHPLMRTTGPEGEALVTAMLENYAARDLLAPGSHLPADARMIAGLPMPVTAIVGTADTAQRRTNAAALAEQGAELRVLAGGHLCNIDDPSGFNAELIATLTASVA